jgi:hypothetical protein
MTLFIGEVEFMSVEIGLSSDKLVGDILFMDGYSYVRGEC